MKKWWHNSTVYQIYPRSFMDYDNDGVGDIKGIIQKLDYIKTLGTDIVWLSPVYKSPMDDNGYDISDYCDIDPLFGDMEDMQELIDKANGLGIKIVMDLVLNHSSDEHNWFIEAKKSKDNEYRDFYIWRDEIEYPIDSFFSGSAWELEPVTKQYYLHLFSKKQPDFNWDNELLRKKLYDMINFWIDKGVSGFRLDVIDLIGKNMETRELGNTEKTHKYIQEMNKNTFGKHDLFTVGETGGANIERAKLFASPERNELNMVFQFEHVGLDEVKGKSKWDLKPLELLELKQTLSKWQTELGTAWNSIYWNNHDQPRILSRWGNDKEYRVESAKMLAILLHFMKGTPYIYQGEELGMTNAYFDSISDYKDVESINMYNERIAKGYSEKDILKSLEVKGRDNARTPMQWDDSKNAGFTEGTPWIKVNDNYVEINAKAEVQDENSIFNCYRKLVEFRKNNDTVVYGEYKLILEEDENVFAYTREYNGEKIVVVCNFYGNEVEVDLNNSVVENEFELIIGNYGDNITNKKFVLKPYEAMACFVK